MVFPMFLLLFHIPHLPLASLPVNEWNLISVYVNVQDTKPIRLSLAPCYVSSNLHYPRFDEWFWILVWYLVIAWFHFNPPGSFWSPVRFQKICLLGSNLANNSDNITPYFNYSNIGINCGVQDIVGIGCQKWRL